MATAVIDEFEESVGLLVALLVGADVGEIALLAAVDSGVFVGSRVGSEVDGTEETIAVGGASVPFEDELPPQPPMIAAVPKTAVIPAMV
ncbi:hypothetical protein [Gorillibacterium massiliense]|uniref:hypothetical protein n=1 Tax=Gorillibacterium massiliense TaxID=1280390 RepID=UPI0004B1ED87